MLFLIVSVILWTLLGDCVAAIPTNPFVNLASMQPKQAMGRSQPDPISKLDSLSVSRTDPRTSGTASRGLLEVQDIEGVSNFANVSLFHDSINGTSCDVICQNYLALQLYCLAPGCGCSQGFLSSKGYCGLCQANDSVAASEVQLLLDAETAQCRRDGVQIHFQLNLDPETQAIVDKVNAENALLRRQQKTFLALQVAGGHVGLPIILAFAVFSQKKRDPTFLNFCFTWTFSSIVYSLLLYGGTVNNTVLNPLGDVSPNECLAQAALTTGAQVMTATSKLALVIRMCLGLQSAIYGGFKDQKQSIYVRVSLIVAPYIFFVVFVLATTFLGKQHFFIENTALQRALPSNFYCTIVQPPAFVRAVYGAVLVIMAFTIFLDIYIITILYRHWSAFRRAKTNTPVSLSLFLRIMLFSLYRIVVTVAYGSVLGDVPNMTYQVHPHLAVTSTLPVWIDMLQAAVPLVGTVVFGVSNDAIISATITFWRKKTAVVSPV